MNDRDFAVVARNVVLLLCALHFEPEVSVPMMIHLWYSALIPAIILEKLQQEILPYIENVCGKINDKAAESIQARILTFAKSSLRILLKKDQWSGLASTFKIPDGLTCETATMVRGQTALSDYRIDHVDRALYSMPPGQRIGCYKLRAEGVLLPFGCPHEDFNTPNP